MRDVSPRYSGQPGVSSGLDENSGLHNCAERGALQNNVSLAAGHYQAPRSHVQLCSRTICRVIHEAYSGYRGGALGFAARHRRARLIG